MTESMLVRSPSAEAEYEFMDPFVEDETPRSRQYSSRVFESNVSHDALAPQAVLLETVRLLPLSPTVREREVTFPSDVAA